MKNSIKKIKSVYLNACQKIGAAKVAPSKAQYQLMLFAFGVTLLSLGLSENAFAQVIGTTGVVNDTRLNAVMQLLFGYIEGSFGALIMVAAGIGAIVSAAFGQYRAALGLLVVAVGAFILRSLVKTFFPTVQIGV
jgi:hypothetical protein